MATSCAPSSCRTFAGGPTSTPRLGHCASLAARGHVAQCYHDEHQRAMRHRCSRRERSAACQYRSKTLSSPVYVKYRCSKMCDAHYLPGGCQHTWSPDMPSTADSRRFFNCSRRGLTILPSRLRASTLLRLPETLDEAGAPTGIARAPVQLRFPLRIRTAPALGHHHDALMADHHPRQPGGYVSRRWRINRAGQKWQPLADRCGFVVGDVVDPGRPALERRQRRGRCISDMGKRPDPTAVADDRQSPPSNRIEERAAPAERCCWTVEPAVAQRGRLSMLGGLKRGFEVANRVQRPAKSGRRMWGPEDRPPS